MYRRRLGLIAVCATALLASCNPKGHVEEARKTAEQFHAGYNRKDYAAMFALAGPAVRKTSSEAEFSRYEAGVHTKLGELKSAQVMNYNLLYLLSGPQVRLDYHCTFASGTGVESFEIDFVKDKGEIDGYRLDSPQLDGKR